MRSLVCRVRGCGGAGAGGCVGVWTGTTLGGGQKRPSQSNAPLAEHLQLVARALELSVPGCCLSHHAVQRTAYEGPGGVMPIRNPAGA